MLQGVYGQHNRTPFYFSFFLLLWAEAEVTRVGGRPGRPGKWVWSGFMMWNSQSIKILCLKKKPAATQKIQPEDPECKDKSLGISCTGILRNGVGQRHRTEDRWEAWTPWPPALSWRNRHVSGTLALTVSAWPFDGSHRFWMNLPCAGRRQVTATPRMLWIQ